MIIDGRMVKDMKRIARQTQLLRRAYNVLEAYQFRDGDPCDINNEDVIGIRKEIEEELNNKGCDCDD